MIKLKKTEGLSIYFSLPKGIYILFAARIINSLGTLIFPFLTLFLTKNLNIKEEIAGIFVTAASLAFVPGALLGGKLTDIIGRKKVYILFQGMAMVCMLPCAFLGDSMKVPWLLILAAFFIAGAQPANTAMVTDLTDERNRKAAFSLIYSGLNIGLGIGSLLAGFLFTSHIKLLFLGCSFAILAAITLVIIFLRETMPSHSMHEVEAGVSEGRSSNSLAKILIKNPVFLLFGMVCVVYSFIHSQYSFSIPLQLNTVFLSKGPEFYGITMAVNSLTIIAVTVFINNITQKNNTLINLIIAGAFFAVGFGIIAFVRSLLPLIISTMIWSIGEILYNTNSGVYIADNAPESHRGRFNALLAIISGAGYAIGPATMGYFIRYSGIYSVWPLLFILSILAMILMYIIYSRYGRKHEKGITGL